jgi:hypothetical protein
MVCAQVAPVGTGWLSSRVVERMRLRPSAPRSVSFQEDTEAAEHHDLAADLAPPTSPLAFNPRRWKTRSDPGCPYLPL